MSALATGQVVARLVALAKKLPNQVARAMYEEALIEMKESMERTPVLTGALRGSHVTQLPKIEGDTISVTIEVGGPSAPYALYVHEDMDAYHKVGQAKFLESVIMESAKDMPRRIASRVDLNRIVEELGIGG